MAVLAQVSDLHLDGTERAWSRAHRVFCYLNGISRSLDAVLVTGDIADHGTAEEYAAAAELFGTLPVPVLHCPGNHDSRPAYREILGPDHGSEEPINVAHAVGGVAVLMVDSTIPGLDEGILAPQTLDWIESAVDGRPTLVAFHHPPVLMRHPLPDTWPLQQPEQLAALLNRHPQIIGVLTGHAHTAAATVFAGRPLLVAPATTWTLTMPWEPETEQPPGFALHIVTGTEMVTHFRVVP